MAIQVPEYLQTKTYSAKKDRRVQQAEVMQEGIVDFGHYKVTQRGAGANMSVDVAAGEAWVDGDSSAEQGFYHVVNDAVVNVAIAAANATNPRIDAIVLAVNDSTEIGGSDEYKLEALTGTATGGASLANLTGKPAIGATKLLLAYVLVPASATKIENAQIGGLRDPRAGLTGYPAEAEPKAVAGAMAQYAHGRPLSFVPAAAVYASAAITPGAGVEIPYNTEIFDTDEIHSTVSQTGRLVAKTPGIYLVTLSLAIEGTNATSFICKNSTSTTESEAADFINSTSSSCAMSAHVRLGYGDYVVSVTNSGAKIVTTGRMPSFRMAWQGP